MTEPSTSYHVLHVKLNSPNFHSTRYLYLKPHASQDGLPKDRALFISGLPVELDEGALLQLFSKYGEVERAAMHGSRVSAVVLYASKKGRDAALKAADKAKVAEVNPSPATKPFGLKAWVEAHKAEKPGNGELQRRLDVWMEEYEAEEERRKAQALAAMQDDGWTVVQRHKGRKKNTSESGTATVGAVAAAAARAAAQKKTPAAHADFYRFQQRDRRRQGEAPEPYCYTVLTVQHFVIFIDVYSYINT